MIREGQEVGDKGRGNHPRPIDGVAAIIPAAGTGTRLGGRIRKPFLALNGEPLLAYTLRALQQSAAIRWILLVVRAGDETRLHRLLRVHRVTKALPLCRGGPSRAESVARGFAAVPREARWILIHDAARPCVSPQVIQRAVQASRRYGAVACGLPAMLTVKAADAVGDVRVTLDRKQLWFMQTPQVFRRDWFADALAQADHRLEQFPDDASVVEAAGFPVRVIEGDPLNIKVTTPEDVLVAEAILAHRRNGVHPRRRR